MVLAGGFSSSKKHEVELLPSSFEPNTQPPPNTLLLQLKKIKKNHLFLCCTQIRIKKKLGRDKGGFEKNSPQIVPRHVTR